MLQNLNIFIPCFSGQISNAVQRITKNHIPNTSFTVVDVVLATGLWLFLLLCLIRVHHRLHLQKDNPLTTSPARRDRDDLTDTPSLHPFGVPKTKGNLKPSTHTQLT